MATPFLPELSRYRAALSAAAFKKGAHICVDGELRSREYETGGAKVRTHDIVACAIINLRAGQRSASAPDPAEAAA